MLLTMLISVSVLAVGSCSGLAWFAHQADKMGDRVRDMETQYTETQWELLTTKKVLNNVTVLYRNDLDELSHSLGNASMLTQNALVMDSLERVRGSRAILEECQGVSCLNWVAQDVLDGVGILLQSPLILVKAHEDNLRRVLKDLRFWISNHPNRVVVSILTSEPQFATLEVLFKEPCEFPMSQMETWGELVSRCSGKISQFQWGEAGRGLTITFPVAEDFNTSSVT